MATYVASGRVIVQAVVAIDATGLEGTGSSPAEARAELGRKIHDTYGKPSAIRATRGDELEVLDISIVHDEVTS